MTHPSFLEITSQKVADCISLFLALGLFKESFCSTFTQRGNHYEKSQFADV